MEIPLRLLRKKSRELSFYYRNIFAAFATDRFADFKLNDTICGCKDSKIVTYANIFTGVKLGATLTNNNVTGEDELSTKFFHTEAFGMRIATVSSGTATFFMCHGTLPRVIKR
jgi:hypothetical protein